MTATLFGVLSMLIAFIIMISVVKSNLPGAHAISIGMYAGTSLIYFISGHIITGSLIAVLMIVLILNLAMHFRNKVGKQ